MPTGPILVTPTPSSRPAGESEPVERDSEADQSRAVRLVRRPRLLGALLAAFFFVQSLQPSLLARDWVFQGVVSGLALTIGYVIGASLSWCAQVIRDRLARGPAPLSPRVDLRLRIAMGIVLLVVVGWTGRNAVQEHRWTWARLDYEPSSAWFVYGGTLVVAALVSGLLLAVAWPVRWLRRQAIRLGDLVLPRWIAAGLATVLVLWAVLAASNTWVYQRSLDGLNETFTLSDLEIEGSAEPPTSRVRSAGPDSQVEWREVGDEGRRFLRRGATVDDLQKLTPGDVDKVTEPVRVYVGRATTDDDEKRAEFALAELEAFGAFEREAVLVVIPTGTGWVNEQIVQPVEHFYAGDVATVSMQYSHLPSPLAFLTEAESARQTGRALIGAVHDRINELPAGERPALLVAGESLGSFGGSAAYDDLDGLVAQTTASLWVGPPVMMHLRREAERNRRPNSLQIRPVLAGDPEILFANRGSDIQGHPQAVFLQHADDAIVWWDADTILSEPDWLAEPLDKAVNPAMDWAPFTTFLNLAVDMAASTAFDEDYGHRYGTMPLTAWAAMLQPDGWDKERIAELRQQLAQLPR